MQQKPTFQKKWAFVVVNWGRVQIDQFGYFWDGLKSGRSFKIYNSLKFNLS